MSPSPRVYTAQHVVAYDYRRSVGPVLGRFFTELRERRIVGNRTAAGRVLCPPMEHDPETSAPTLPGFEEVGPGGVVTTWSWVAAPRAKHGRERPFAWALIRLDGADTSILHAVDAGSEPRMRTGMRVRPRWRAETRGEIGDIECFEPEAGA
jgi:hypothetical protein